MWNVLEQDTEMSMLSLVNYKQILVHIEVYGLATYIFTQTTCSNYWVQGESKNTYFNHILVVSVASV